MSGCGSFLEGQTDELSRAAAEAVDMETVEEALRAVADQLAQCVDAQTALDLAPLAAVEPNAAQQARLVRALEVQCIEFLRACITGDAFSDCVLALRATVQKSLPPNDTCAQGVSRFQSLIHGESEATERDAQCSLDLLIGMMRAVPNLVYLHDMYGNLYYLNDLGLEMVGYTRDDIAAGLSVHDFVVPDYVDLVESRMVSIHSRVSPFTIEIYAKNGDRIPVEITTRLVRDHGFNQDLVLGIARDLRLERRLQSDIARGNDFLDGIMNHAPCGILVTDHHFTILEANQSAAQLAGAPSIHALVGLHVADLLEGPRDEVNAWLQSALDSGSECNETMSLRSRFGHPFSCQCLAAPLRKGHGACGGLLILVSETRPAPQPANGISQVDLTALGNVVGRIAHELNNPLTGIIGYAEVLRQLSEDAKFRTRLDHVLEESHRCRRIIESLQAFVDRGERRQGDLDLNQVVGETVALIQYQLSINRIQVQMDLGELDHPVRASEDDVRRAVLNILVNAQQALQSVSDRDRVLRIVTRSTPDGATELLIEDNGPGIADHIRNRIFEPFFTTREVGEGIGLGLSIAYVAIRSAGGSLSHEPVDPTGARFVLRFARGD